MTLQQLQAFEASNFARIVAACTSAEDAAPAGQRDRTRRGTDHGNAMAARRAARRERQRTRNAFLDSAR